MFKVLAQLKNLLTTRNLEYLDAVLTLLIEEQNNPAYHHFWLQFRQRFPRQGSASSDAWSALRRLRWIVKEQLKEQRSGQ